MNKLFIAASTAVIDLIAADPSSPITHTAGTKGASLKRCFNYLRLRKTTQVKTDPVVSVDSTVINERGWETDRHHSPLYDLAASHPHVIAASLFTRKVR
jgi:hypothetical protein